jgi:hypothetical protein
MMILDLDLILGLKTTLGRNGTGHDAGLQTTRPLAVPRWNQPGS